MRKVVAYELLSLDGVAEDQDAFFTEFDEVMGDRTRSCSGMTDDERTAG